jgi:hypothetical protein
LADFPDAPESLSDLLFELGFDYVHVIGVLVATIFFRYRQTGRPTAAGVQDVSITTQSGRALPAAVSMASSPNTNDPSSE